MQAYEQKMRACTGKRKCQNEQRSVHRELADFPDSGTPCRQFGVQEQPHDALVQDQVLLHMRAWRQKSFEKDPDRCFYHICVTLSFQSVLVIIADFGRADTSKSSQVVVSGPDRAAGHQEAPLLPSKDPNLQNAHLRGARLAKSQFPFVSVEAAVECAQVGGRLAQTTNHNPGDTFLCP